MNCRRDIAAWDGKSSADIEAIYRRYRDDASFPCELVECCRDAGLQKGASWMLKRCFEDGRGPSADAIAVLLERLAELEHWESKLHLLQCLPQIRIEKAAAAAVEAFLRDCLGHDNKFVRAWAYGGFIELSRQYPRYRREAKALLEVAQRDEAPSVRARIRNITIADL